MIARLVRYALCAAVLAGPAACNCGGPEPLPPECEDHPLLTDAFGGIAAANLARFTLKDRSVAADDGTGLVTVTRIYTVSGTFFDITAVDTDPPSALALPPSTSCVGVTGRTVQTGDPVPLAVTGVTMDGGELPAPLVLTETSMGSALWGLTGSQPGTLFGATELPLDITVTSAGGMGTFPAFVLAHDTPIRPTVSSPDLTTYLTLLVEEGLVFQWDAGPAGTTDIIEIAVHPVFEPGDTRTWELVCYTLDDGCHRVPYEALNWVAAIDRSEFTVELTRHRLVVDELGVNPGEDVGITLMSASHVAPAVR